MNLKRTKKGFTIVELVIVVGVIGILSAILIPTFVNLTEQAKERANQIEARDAYTAYVAVAVDELIDAEEAEELGVTLDEGTTVAIEYKAQDLVSLTKGNKIYVWDKEKSVWKAGTALTTLVASDKDSGKATVEDTIRTKLSTFNGWTVHYAA